ncbi:MAG: FAD-binding protein [Pelagibacterium sp.]|uniref:FAD-dependent oxidoreductase n=1 Tax=Pelagibacterium sp. TaxID=1967288 RepID=UPI0032EF3684
MKYEADLVIIGGGIAGMVCALRAAVGGKSVIVLEAGSDERYLCNSRVTGGVFHVCLRDINSPEQDLEQAIVDATNGQAHTALAGAVARDAKRVVKWLQGRGIRFMRASPAPHHSVALAPPALVRVGLQFEGRAGDVLLRSLEQQLNEAGGKVLRGHRVKRLLQSESACIGVEAETEEGVVQVMAENTLIADGGFQCDDFRLQDAGIVAPDLVVQRNAGTGRGDGIRMALEFGAAISELSGFYGHVLARAARENNRLWPYPWLDELMMDGMLVDDKGRRFLDEGRGGIYAANVIALRDDPLSTTVIFDSEAWAEAKKSRALPPNPNLEKEGAEVHVAETIEDLALKIGVDPIQLSQTIEAHNDAVANGSLGSLTPPRSEKSMPARPISKAPYYAIPASAGVTYTMGGIAIDEWSRALDPSGAPINGLFAAGSASGGLEGGPNFGYVGGLSKAAVTGFRAAGFMLGDQHAA